MNTDQRPGLPASHGEYVVEDAAEQVFTSEGGHVATCSDEGAQPPSEARLLEELGIRYDGRDYWFQSYRYTRLDDAVAYARLVRSRASDNSREDQANP